MRMPRSSEEKSRGRCLLDQVGHRVADLLVLRPVLHLALSEKKRKSVSETHEDGGRRLRGLTSEVATVPESTPAGFCVFLSDPESKFCEKPDADSLFNFGRSRSPV